jgi:hypothetical protein
MDADKLTREACHTQIGSKTQKTISSLSINNESTKASSSVLFEQTGSPAVK